MRLFRKLCVTLVLLLIPISISSADVTPSPSPSATVKAKYSPEAIAAYKQAVVTAKNRFQLAVADATSQLQEELKAAGSNVSLIKAARARYNANYQMAFKAMTSYLESAKLALASSVKS